MDMLSGEEITAAGLTDWRKLGQGLHARFLVRDFRAGARFLTAIGEAGAAGGHHPQARMGPGFVDLKLISDDAVYRDDAGTEHRVEWVTRQDVELAHRITEIAAELSLAPDPQSIIAVELGLDTANAAVLAPVWSALLTGDGEAQGRGTIGDDVRDATGRVPILWFQDTDAHETPRQRFHLDVQVPYDVAERRIAAAVAEGAVIVDDSRAPRTTVIADPDGNKACVGTFQPAADPTGGADVSEQGWREFLAADGVADWVVLHGGALAVFDVASLTAAARLVEAVAQIPGVEGAGIVMTIADHQLTVRLARDVWLLESRHVDLARAVSEVARRLGAAADRSGAQEVQLAIAARPDAVDVDFWRAVLGYVGLSDDNAADPLGHGSTVWMQELDETKPLRHAMHVDVSVAREHIESRLAAALAAGGRIVDESSAPAHWTLADSAGNRVCICAWPDGAGVIAPDPVDGVDPSPPAVS